MQQRRYHLILMLIGITRAPEEINHPLIKNYSTWWEAHFIACHGHGFLSEWRMANTSNISGALHVTFLIGIILSGR
jgi:hypothetical protein